MTLLRNFAACTLALAAVAATSSAFAKDGGAVFGPTLLNSTSAFAVTQGVAANIVTFNVAGINSFDELGEPTNVVRFLNVGAGNEVIGIGWNVTLTAFAPSWLSEFGVAFGGSGDPAVLLAPGDVDEPGTASYSSNGIVDLVPLGFNFNVLADGQLRMEFFESFDDFPGGIDGRWVSGTLSIQLAQPIPEPSTYGLMAIGLLAVGALVRRKQSRG